MNVLITGASGFIGSALHSELKNKYFFRLASRTSINDTDHYSIKTLDAETDWTSPLDKCDVVIHLASIAHIFDKSISNTEINNVNINATINIAKQAISAGVKRFIYISSIGVHGSTSLDPLTENSKINPHNDYANSKLLAELALQNLCKESKMEFVIIRPPLVYAANAPGNFKKLLSLLDSQIPLPFKGINNRRSMVSLTDLLRFIDICITHPDAANKIFLVSDETPVSISEIAYALRKGMNRPIRLFYLPKLLLWLIFSSLGKKKAFNQLYDSLEIDAHEASTLGWKAKEHTINNLIKIGKEYTLNKSDGAA